ncbi:transaldolase family protein [Streptomyces sp. NPDC059582]|uniref:transaldolase family protein n=1 Tax=Streptomyces sp. NPDC059582 TaxID=3346875 RepID=UPI0036BC7EBF
MPTPTVIQAVRLWETAAEPDPSVKIPALRQGLAAITAAVARGISVNITLIFSLDRYRAVIKAHQSRLWIPPRAAVV